MNLPKTGFTILLGAVQGDEMLKETIGIYLERGWSGTDIIRGLCVAGVLLLDELANDQSMTQEEILGNMIEIASAIDDAQEEEQ